MRIDADQMVDEPSDEVLAHYGTPHEGSKSHSGRYRYGSGEEPYQHGMDFRARIDFLSKEGMSEKDIAKHFGLTTTQLRAQAQLARYEERSELSAQARRYRDKGMSLNAITEKMGYNNNSSVRSLLNEDAERRMGQAMKTAEFLKQQVKEKGFIDVGAGVERECGVSTEKMNTALYILELEGYPTYKRGVAQLTNPGKQTNFKVLCPPGTEWKDVYADVSKIKTVTEYKRSEDEKGEDVYVPKFRPPASLDSKRVGIRYAEDGGIEQDGLVEIRRGVKDLDLGGSHYAQVRIMVDGTHYIKGMAVYSDNLPDGVDVMFNTNKTKGTPMCGPKDNTVLKNIKKDPENPFGALIREEGGQSDYKGSDGKMHLSPINKCRIEGDWDEWVNKLPSQFLVKQNAKLIKQQLDLTIANKQAEFDEIKSLTNPTVKKKLLSEFASSCDSDSIHLKAAALPRQRYQVMLPMKTLGDNECYAPNYKDGEKLALVRFPHGGTFEIPIVTVNNRSPQGKKMTGGNPLDVIGVNARVAERLSGADFDGDTVIAIPTNSRINITSTPQLEGLKGFDPKVSYGGKPEGTFKPMRNTQTEMGIVSNLITDMTIRGANEKELAAAVRHSMVVIDAEKHGLDYQQSAKDNHIKELKLKYQGHYEDDGKLHTGASTIISRAKNEKPVLKRKGSPTIDPETGELRWKEVHETYVDKHGKTQVRTQKSTQMAETRDAHTLKSGTANIKEDLYADYANTMKRMANEARLMQLNAGKVAYNKSARLKYANEVASLDDKLSQALKNRPKERQAQVLGNAEVENLRAANPDMTKSELKKARQKAMIKARAAVGAERSPIPISDKEWEAIQAGAISEHQLTQILNNTDTDRIRQLATPRTNRSLSDSQIALISARKAAGHTNEEIANSLGVSVSTIIKYSKKA